MENLQLLGSLFLAIVLGSIVGLEREANNHPAGIRTHALVCIGSTLVTIVSWQTFVQFQHGGDPTRIAAQIISGIGFLGAGTIMREGANIKGLTTAASLWTVAAVGLGVGFGYYFVSISTTIITVIVLRMFHKWEKIFVFTKQYLSIKIVVVDKPGMLGRIGQILGMMNVDIKNIQMEPSGNEMQIMLQLKIPSRQTSDEVADQILKIDGVKSLEFQ